MKQEFLQLGMEFTIREVRPSDGEVVGVKPSDRLVVVGIAHYDYTATTKPFKRPGVFIAFALPDAMSKTKENSNPMWFERYRFKSADRLPTDIYDLRTARLPSAQAIVVQDIYQHNINSSSEFEGCVMHNKRIVVPTDAKKLEFRASYVELWNYSPRGIVARIPNGATTQYVLHGTKIRYLNDCPQFRAPVPSACFKVTVLEGSNGPG
jgi:hypothetical protein